MQIQREKLDNEPEGKKIIIAILFLKFNPVFACSIFRKEEGNVNEAAVSVQQLFNHVAPPFVHCSSVMSCHLLLSGDKEESDYIR